MSTATGPSGWWARLDAAVGGAIERLLGRLPIGWLQLRHNRTRLIAAIGGVAFASLLVLMQLGFQGALVGSIGLPYRALEADLLISASDMNTLVDANPGRSCPPAAGDVRTRRTERDTGPPGPPGLAQA